jgi:hypothetical protein
MDKVDNEGFALPQYLYRPVWRSYMNLHATAATKANYDSLYRSEALELG